VKSYPVNRNRSSARHPHRVDFAAAVTDKADRRPALAPHPSPSRTADPVEHATFVAPVAENLGRRDRLSRAPAHRKGRAPGS
jgi:hypothetical protein